MTGILARFHGKIAIYSADITKLLVGGTAINADAADLNAPRIAKMAVVLTAGTYTVETLPANSVLEQVILQVSAAFDGTLQLGKTGAVDAYVTDANFVKTVIATPDPLLVGAFIDASTAIKLKVTGCTTGAGIIWLIYRVLP